MYVKVQVDVSTSLECKKLCKKEHNYAHPKKGKLYENFQNPKLPERREKNRIH